MPEISFTGGELRLQRSWWSVPSTVAYTLLKSDGIYFVNPMAYTFK